MSLTKKGKSLVLLLIQKDSDHKSSSKKLKEAEEAEQQAYKEKIAAAEALLKHLGEEEQYSGEKIIVENTLVYFENGKVVIEKGVFGN